MVTRPVKIRDYCGWIAAEISKTISAQAKLSSQLAEFQRRYDAAPWYKRAFMGNPADRRRWDNPYHWIDCDNYALNRRVEWLEQERTSAEYLENNGFDFLQISNESDFWKSLK